MTVHVYTYIYSLAGSGNALWFSLSDSAWVMVVSLGNGLEENPRAVISHCPGGTLCLGTGATAGVGDVAEV